MRRLKLNILQKYILFLMFVSVIPLFITGLVSFQISHQVLMDETSRYATLLVNSQKQYLELETEQIKALMANILSVEAITRTFEAQPAASDSYTALATQAQIGYILNGYSNLRGLVSIDLFSLNGTHYHVGDTLNTLEIRTEVLDRVSRRLNEAGSGTVWIGVEDNVNVNSAHPIVLTAAQLITRPNPQAPEERVAGLILVNYNLSTLYDQFYRAQPDSQAYQMIFDAQQRIIFHPNRKLIGQRLSTAMAAQFNNPAGNLLLTVDGQATYITYTHLDDYDWVIMHLIPQSEIDGKTSLIGMVTLICMIACLVLVIAYAIVYSRQVVVPVRAIIHQFQLFQAGVLNWNRILPVPPGKDEIGELVRWFNTFSDSLIARQEAESRLRHEAFYDLLTDLPNRALFMDRLEQAIIRSQRYQDEHFAVLFMDIDQFKLINDSLGHSVGDDLLKVVAEQLEKCLRATDTVARLGGDEFVMLLNNIHHIDEAIQVAERILKAIGNPVVLSGHQVVISTSIGILFSDPGYDSPMAYLRDADIAMYWAKSQGKARYEIFTASMRESVIYRMGMETDLRQAIEAGQIQVYYQPIVSLQSGQVISFEALLRWTHPLLGPVSPARFIEVAEETGLIHSLGQLVLREACRQTAAWQREFPLETPLMVNINISRRQFIQKDLVERISAILEECGLAADALNLEITESVIMQDMRATDRMLNQLKQLGVHIEMDDFGSGYSSLNHLTRFKFDVIKIDRSFVNEMLTDQRQTGLVQSIISMAHSLGMVVVAEGIENEEQLNWLKACGCEYGQGYLFSPALNSQEAIQYLHKNLTRVI